MKNFNFRLLTHFDHVPKVHAHLEVIFTIVLYVFTGDVQSTDSPGFELFDSDNGHDLTLSPQTFTANTTADSFLVNDNSNSIGMPVVESDTGKVNIYVYHLCRGFGWPF